jgi:hypothetical protein
MADRTARVELGPDVFESVSELDQASPCRVLANCLEMIGMRAGCDQVAAVMLTRPRDESYDGRSADPPARRTDGAAECLSVDGVLNQVQVGERVADLGALVQPERAEHPVRDPGVRERPLQRLGRISRSGEREDLGWWGSGGERVSDLAGHPMRLRVLIRERHDAHVAAVAAHRDQCLRRSTLVVRHASGRGVEDLRA